MEPEPERDDEYHHQHHHHREQTVGRKRNASNEDFFEIPIKRSSSDCCLKSNRMEIDIDADTSTGELAVAVAAASSSSSSSSFTTTTPSRVRLPPKMNPPTSTSTSTSTSTGKPYALKSKSKSSHALGRAGLSFSQQNLHSIKAIKSYVSNDFGLGVALPSTSLTRLNRSNSSFLNSYLSKAENTLIGDRVNASFTFIQRSDKESLMRTVNLIHDLVKEQKQEETREYEHVSIAQAQAQKELNNKYLDPVDETEHDFQETSKSEVSDLSRSISTIKSQEEVRPSLYSTAATSANVSNTTTTTTTATTTTSLDSLSSRYLSRASTICRHLVRLHSYVQDEFYRIVLGVSALKVTLEAMDAFPYHEFVQATCNLTLGGLCQSNLMNGLTLVKSGGVVSILNSIKLFPDSSHVCSMAVNCLALATSTTELCVLYLKQMKDGRKTIGAIPDSMLSFEAPKNKDLILKRIESATL